MIHLYLSLGSNMGDRHANIVSALSLLDEAFGRHYKRISGIIETPSWGFKSEDFLNCAVLYALPRKRTDIQDQALEILDCIKKIELALGREQKLEYDGEGRRIYHPRPIDIDILLFGTHVIDHPRLQVPHPLMAERDFVMRPLRQIANRRVMDAFPDRFKMK
jgi:2-amino-4-hydroxy-6-hydroxymethyldihydropteridine diphosphokinase